jgi:pilus assembly protein CpaF
MMAHLAAPLVDFDVEVTFPDARKTRSSFRGVAGIGVGRDLHCAVVVASPAVSRKHVEFLAAEHGLIAVDHSQNGTLIDGQLLKAATRQIHRAQCQAQVGPFLLKVSMSNSALASHGEAPARQPDLPLQPAQLPQPVSPLVPVVASAQQPADAVDTAPVRRRIHNLLLDYLELPKLERAMIHDPAMRDRVTAALQRILDELHQELPANLDRARWIRELSDEVLGLGPLEQLLADATVSEIMVVDPSNIYAERSGRLTLTDLRFTDNESVRAIIERIVTPLGRRIDESSPIVDARLKDGSRVNAVIPPLAIKGPCITIRKFATRRLTTTDLIGFGSFNAAMAQFLENAVRVRRNIVISGGTGSGKTTLLNVLSSAIPEHERVVTIEDAAELQLAQPHVVSLESKPANLEGKGEYTIRDLVKNALRMRPDRILVGECRGGEALDMLQAMNTGHDGSMTSTHANSPREAVARIETLCLMAGVDLPVRAIRAQIASSVHLIVQQSRFGDGSRRVVSVAEVCGIDDHGEVALRELYSFQRTGNDEQGRIRGEFLATGYLPECLDRFAAEGLLPAEDAA